MRLSLKRLARRDPAKPTLRQRAAALKASAARVIGRRRYGQVTGQPEGESLPHGRGVDGLGDAFTGLDRPCNDLFRLDDDPSRTSATGDAKPYRENRMARPQINSSADPRAAESGPDHARQSIRSAPPRARAAALKARLAETRERAGRALAVAKILMKPEAPKPAPVDRAALVNYITFLALEREQASAELYPHMSWRARRFVLSMNAAWRFFHDGDNSTAPRKNLTPASTRALSVLDLVGIDWREDTDADSRRFFDGGDRADTGDRPGQPNGMPAADAVLVAALDDLTRLDRALDALGGGDRDTDEVPGYDALNTARWAALSLLEQERPETLLGLRAKARAILCDSLKGDFETVENLGRSLARDLLGAHHSALEPRPDPILAAIAECERLETICAAVDRDTPPDEDVPSEPGSAVMAHVTDTLLKTVPTTAEGCKALARFLPPFIQRWAYHADEDVEKAFALIARSPLL